jgi:hypothetical protein
MFLNARGISISIYTRPLTASPIIVRLLGSDYPPENLPPLAGKPRLFDQVGSGAAVDDAEHLAHDGRAARAQDT